MHFPILQKLAAIQAKPDLKIQPAQPIAPLTDPSQAQSSVGAAAIQAGPGGAAPFPNGPQSLHAGQPDQSAAMAEQAKLQEAQIKEQERQQKVQEELHKTRNELVQTKAEAVKAQAQIDAAKAREDMVTDKEKALDHHTKMIEKARKLESRPTLLSASSDRIAKKVEAMGSNLKFAHLAFCKIGSPAVPSPVIPPASTPPTGAVPPTSEPGVSAPGAPTGIATNGVPQVRNYDNTFIPASQFVSRPAALTANPLPAARPLGGGQGNPGFTPVSNSGTQPVGLHVTGYKDNPDGTTTNQLSDGTTTLGRMSYDGKGNGTYTPVGPVGQPATTGTAMDPNVLRKQMPGLERFMPNTFKQVVSGQKNLDQAKLMMQNTQGIRNQMMQNQVGIDYANDPNSAGARNMEGFINADPNYYQNRTGFMGGNHLWNKALDYGLGVTQDVGRNEYLGGQAYGEGDYLEAARRAADTTGTVFNNAILPASVGGIGAASKLPFMTRLAQGAGRFGAEAGLSQVGTPLDSLSQWNHDGNAEYGDLAQGSRAWQVGGQHLSPEDELSQANSSIGRANGSPAAAGGYVPNRDDMQELQRTGYFHQDQFAPMENWRTQFQNPYLNQGYHMLAPMFYPGVNMQPYNGQQGGFDPMGRMQAMANMLPQQFMR
jgi:hypothetical protein